MVLPDYLTQSSREASDRVALVCGEARFTYGELGASAGFFASTLLAGGLMRGDRVAVLLDNCPEAVVAIFGILEAGGCIVVINPATQAERLGQILENCTPRFMVLSPDKRKTLDQVGQGAWKRPELFLTGTDDDSTDAAGFSRACREQPFLPRPRLLDADLAAIIYTSGSTGRPKGVTHLHLSVDKAAESVADYLGNNGKDVILNVLPLSSSYGLMQLMVTFRTGACLVLEKGFGFPYEMVKRIREEKVTGLAGAPTTWALLLKLEGLEPGDLASLRYITNAAAALPASFIPRLRKAMPSVKIFMMHGLTECLRTTYLPPEEIETRPTSVGIGMRNVELWIEDSDGQRLGPGQTGEMIVRGPTLMVGYWNDPEATAKALIPGPYPWERVLRTRDLFTMDADGYFHFVARSDELIKSKGEKVSPIEVEDVIYTLEAVLENRVIGVPDEVLGQAVRSEIVVKDGKKLTVQEVKAHCRRFLEDFKIPTQVVFVDSLPKTQGGKIKRSG